MISGELAAKAILESRGDPALLCPRYQKACDREIGTELRDSILIQRYLFRDRRRIARVIGGASRNRAATKLILDLAIGRRPYSNVRRRLLAGSPLLSLRFAWERLRHGCHS
jgi:flavin-dependent dehydrogenase